MIRSTTTRIVKKRKSGSSLTQAWDDPCQSAFDTLKVHLVQTPILGFADYTKPFILETDASKQGLGALLSQEQDGNRRVIAYASRRLRGSETNMLNYSSMKLEMLTLKWLVSEKFRSYLFVSKFILYTDNNPLTYFQKTKLGEVEQNWAAELAIFDFTLKYRSGRANVNADCLSRQPHDDCGDSYIGEHFGIPMCSIHIGQLVAGFDQGTMLPVEIQNVFAAVTAAHNHKNLTASYTLPGVKPAYLKTIQKEDPTIQSFLKYWKRNRGTNVSGAKS